MVIRTPYGLAKIKVCENDAFHFWMALIFWYNRPRWWLFCRHFIHIAAWLFCIFSAYRSAKSHRHSFLSLDYLISFFTENIESTMVGVAQWIECQPANQRAAGLIPSQGTCLGCGPGPKLGAHKRQPHIDVSLPFFLLPFPSIKINK